MKHKVIIVLNSAEQLGGTEKHVENLITGLSSDFDFIVCCKKGPFVTNFEKAGATYIELYPKFEFDIGYISKLVKLFKTTKPSVLHANQLKAGSLATIAGFIAGVPIRIYHEHTPIWQWPLPKWKKYTTFWLNWLVNFLVGNIFATHVIALTEEIKKERIKKELISSRKIVIVPNGIITDTKIKGEKLKEEREKIRKSWGISKNDFVIGNISRLTEEKGHEVLLRAFAEVSKDHRIAQKYKNLFLIIGGNGHLKEKLVDLAKKLQVENYVKFLGAFKEEDKFKILSGFDLFVFPSFAEGFGIVLLEAMLAGLNVISSNLPVLKEVGGNDVTYFSKGNDKSLSEAVKNYLQNPDGFNQKGSERVKSLYSMEHFIDCYKKLYLSKN